MRVWILALLLAVYCNPNECRDDFDCDPGCYCYGGRCG